MAESKARPAPRKQPLRAILARCEGLDLDQLQQIERRILELMQSRKRERAAELMARREQIERQLAGLG